MKKMILKWWTKMIRLSKKCNNKTLGKAVFLQNINENTTKVQTNVKPKSYQIILFCIYILFNLILHCLQWI